MNSRKPAIYHLYWGEDQPPMALGQPNVDGNIHLIRPFDIGVLHHSQQTSIGQPLVGVVQLYLDLFANGQTQAALHLRTAQF
jgi:hypothetical protein